MLRATRLLLPVLLASTAVGQCVSTWQAVAGYQGIDGFPAVSTAWDPDGPGPLTPRFVVAGLFSAVGSVPADNIAAYDPATGQWSTFGSGTNQAVNALLALPNGDLIAGGNFTAAGGVPAAYIARWNGTSWSPLGSGMDSYVAALALDANGQLLAGGGFLTAGGVQAAGIARWNGSSWSAVGSITPGGPLSIDALAVLPNGDIVAGGFFGWIGGTFANHIAKWNGSTWSPLGAGVLQGTGVPMVRKLVVLPNGDLLANGSFTQIGTVTTRPARWDGSNWQPFQVTAGAVGDVVVLPNGNLLLSSLSGGTGIVEQWNGVSTTQLGGAFRGVAPGLCALSGSFLAFGGFEEVAGMQAQRTALWNGATWAPLTVGGFSHSIRALARAANGDALAGGDFAFVGNVAASRVARFDGTSWSAVGSGMLGSVRAIGERPNGDIVVAGEIAVGGSPTATSLARWDGTAWSPVPGAPFTIDTMTIAPNGDVIVSGSAPSPPLGLRRTSRWDGSTWTHLGAASQSSQAAAFAVAANGDVIAAGSFLNMGNLGVRYLARWTGATWTTIGTAPDNEVRAVLVTRSGVLVAAGPFTTIGGTAANGIASWDGVAWSALGAGPGVQVDGLFELPDGGLLAYGTSGVARWNGSSWTPSGAFGNALLRAMTLLRDGSVLLGGQITRVNGQVTTHTARLVASCPATANVSGAGCSSLVGPMQLTATDLPWLNGTYRATCSGMSPFGIGLGVFGFASPGVALSALHPTGGAGCTLWASQDLLNALLPVNGSVVDQLAIPPSPTLVGIAVQHQVVQLEFAAQALVRISGSNGLQLTIGTY